MKGNEAKYIAIASALRKSILSGHYETHDRFPSEEALARRFGASRPTIERALRELKREGQRPRCPQPQPETAQTPKSSYPQKQHDTAIKFLLFLESRP